MKFESSKCFDLLQKNNIYMCMYGQHQGSYDSAITNHNNIAECAQSIPNYKISSCGTIPDWETEIQNWNGKYDIKFCTKMFHSERDWIFCNQEVVGEDITHSQEHEL